MKQTPSSTGKKTKQTNPNFVPNGDFETGVLAPWKINMGQVDVVQYAGSWHAKVGAYIENGHSIFNSADVGPGHYTFGLSCIAPDNTSLDPELRPVVAWTCLYQKPELNGPVIVSQGVGVIGSRTKTFESKFDIPQGVRSLYIAIALSGDADGLMGPSYLDNVYLIKSDE